MPTFPALGPDGEITTPKTVAWLDGRYQQQGADPGAAVNTVEAVVHGADANVARPTGAVVVYWYGSADPVNAAVRDEWIQE